MKRLIPHLFVLAVVAGVSLEAQNSGLFEKAPPYLDDALRARVAIFYQAHVDGKFREADTVVHEDSKDAFFVAEKNRHNGFAILTIKYSEDFTHANVVTEIDTDFVMPGFAKQAVKIPMTTMWKLDEGEWWWYVLPPELGRDSPFGRLVPGAEDSSGGIAQRLGSMPSAEAIQNLVRVDKTDVILKSDEASSDEIQISNGMPGPVTLKLEAPKVEGLEIRVEPTQVPARGRAKIVFTYTPDEDKIRPQYVEGTLEIQPTNHFLPVRIAIAPPQGDPPPIPEAKP